MFEMVIPSLKCDSNIFFVYKHINDTSPDHIRGKIENALFISRYAAAAVLDVLSGEFVISSRLVAHVLVLQVTNLTIITPIS